MAVHPEQRGVGSVVPPEGTMPMHETSIINWSGRGVILRARARRAVATALVALLALASSASGHPDAAVVDGRLHLGPGEQAVFPMSVHYHRLVATYRLDGAPSVALEVRAGADDAAGAIVHRTTLDGSGRLHHLVACCLGVGFSDFTLVVRNDGAEAARLDLRAWIVHDEFAVVAYAAEAGAVEVPGALFLGLGIGATLAAAGARRRRDAPGGTTSSAAEAVAARAYRWSLGTFVGGVAVAVALGAAGAVRYDAGLVGGMAAIMADIPVPGGPFGSRAASLMGLLLVAWIVSVVLWIVAVRRGPVPTDARVVRLGAALAVVHLSGGLALAWTYGAYLVPVGLGLVLAAPLAVSAVGLWRTGREIAPVVAPAR
jgi:hypothetical protein